MRIAVVGGGGAGLCCAWLLEAGGHDVVLFEQSERLGGHVHTVDVAAGNGAPLRVEAGTRFLSRGNWPTMLRLLEHLDVPLREYDQTLTFHERDSGWTVPLPPAGSWARRLSVLRPRTASALLGFSRLLRHARPLVREADRRQTLGEALEGLGLSANLRERFVLPFFASNWGLPVHEVGGLSAANALAYAAVNDPSNPGASRWVEVPEGLSSYVDALVASLERTRLLAGPGAGAVRALRHEPGRGYEVVTEENVDGAARPHRFDHVVLALAAEDARPLVATLPATERIRSVLGRFEYFDATVAIHGDPALLPARRSSWSIVNLVREGSVCGIHEWCGWRERRDVFRSWISASGREPEPRRVHFVGRYRHARPTPDYFAAHEALRPLQGREGLWFAGVWTAGIDNHDSAIRSAVRIAEALAPGTERLAALSPGP